MTDRIVICPGCQQPKRPVSGPDHPYCGACASDFRELVARLDRITAACKRKVPISVYRDGEPVNALYRRRCARTSPRAGESFPTFQYEPMGYMSLPLTIDRLAMAETKARLDRDYPDC